MKLILGDCIEKLKNMPSNSVDLVYTDPPYFYTCTKAGNSFFQKSLTTVFNELKQDNIVQGYSEEEVWTVLLRINKKVNMYFWCSREQIPKYLDFFVTRNKAKFEILIWAKTNAIPTYNNKYISDKEYCLYFRRGGYCQPQCKKDGETIFLQATNQADKKLYKHPTIKPLNIVQTMIKNSSKPGEVVLDPFMGSGTTGVACKLLGRDFVGMEINKEYFDIAKQRIEGTKVVEQLSLFE